jgi:hypothetical protein
MEIVRVGADSTWWWNQFDEQEEADQSEKNIRRMHNCIREQ